MKSVSVRQRRKQDIRRRVANSKHDYPVCRIFGCRQLTTAAAKKGLNNLYCRRHEDHFERHGSYVQRSYGAKEIRPLREAAERWVQANLETAEVRHAVGAVGRLLRSAGPRVEAFRLAGKPPSERARATWAQIRERKIEPAVIVASWLAMVELIRNDPQ